MMEEAVKFKAGELSLEGMFSKQPGNRGVIVCHPHPLYGGDLANPVVESLVDSYRRKGFSTLRFNFRGVGNSEGEYGDGIDEQQDILAALEFCLGHGLETLHLAGYSFGAWVVAHTTNLPDPVKCKVLISPPLALMPFSTTGPIERLALVITGEEDEIAPPHLIEQHLEGWNKTLKYMVIDHADHFYFGSFPALEENVHLFLRDWAAQGPKASS
jgi:alpha/beta superfamily hydrolase